MNCFEDHGLPLVQLKEQRRELVMALMGRKDHSDIFGCATCGSICDGDTPGTQNVPVLPMQTGGDRKSSWVTNKSGRALQPAPLAKCREINSRRGVPSRRAITGAKL